jgi:hypothetical protein
MNWWFLIAFFVFFVASQTPGVNYRILPDSGNNFPETTCDDTDLHCLKAKEIVSHLSTLPYYRDLKVLIETEIGKTIIFSSENKTSPFIIRITI